jgi:2-haloalkanoic acid dehalogenase type II
VDWEGGVAGFLYDLARRNGDDDPGAGRALRERWEELQFDELQGDYRSYRDILRDSLAEWCGERGYHWNDNDAGALLRAMESWQPFPDTVPALRRAKDAGLRLAIVSNTDRSIMDHTLRHLEIPFDEVIVAEDARAYKPSRQPFQLALDTLGEDPENVLHVAFGFKYDIGPAQELGFSTAWVNRHQEPAPGSERPDHEWPDLWPLAELAESR